MDEAAEELWPEALGSLLDAAGTACRAYGRTLPPEGVKDWMRRYVAQREARALRDELEAWGAALAEEVDGPPWAALARLAESKTARKEMPSTVARCEALARKMRSIEDGKVRLTARQRWLLVSMSERERCAVERDREGKGHDVAMVRQQLPGDRGLGATIRSLKERGYVSEDRDARLRLTEEGRRVVRTSGKGPGADGPPWKKL